MEISRKRFISTEHEEQSNMPRLVLKRLNIDSLASPSKKLRQKKVTFEVVLTKKKESSEEADPDQDEDECDPDLSEYEKLQQKNIKERMAYLESLGIDKDKKELIETKHRPSQRGLKPKPKEVLPLRPRSLRLQKKDPDGLPLPDNFKEPTLFSWSSTLSSISWDAEEERPQKPLEPLPLKDVYKNESDGIDSDLLLALINSVSDYFDAEKFDNRNQLSNTHLKSICKEMKITSEHVAKVVPQRIFSVAVHPNNQKFIAFAGSKFGRIGVWDILSKERNDGVWLFEPHSRPITCLEIPKENPDYLYSSSYDSTIRKLNVERGTFDLVFSAPKDDYQGWVTYFDFLSPTELCFAQGNGCISIRDTRLNSTTQTILVQPSDIKKLSVRTVSIHPMQKHYVVTTYNSGCVSLWDLRNVKKYHPICNLTESSRMTNSAFFSPVDGNRILTTSLDDHIRVYDSSVIDNKIKMVTSLKHNNQTGRWLSKFKAVWVPGMENAFIVGSMNYPRQIEMFSAGGDLIHSFKGEDFSSICSLVAFHPTENWLVGGNSSGRMFAFM